MSAWAIVACLLVLAGAVLGYAGARHQQLSTAPRPLLRWIGGLALAGSLMLMLGWFGPATAIFAWTTLIMLTWTIVPLVAGWLRRPRGKR